MDYREALLEVDELRSEAESLPPLDLEQEAELFEKFQLGWDFHSTAMGGNALTESETRALLIDGLTGDGKPFKDHTEIRGHDRAVKRVREWVRYRTDLTEVGIRELHGLLLGESFSRKVVTPAGLHAEERVEIGQYKRSPNFIINEDGELHPFVNPYDTPARMGELLKWYRDRLGASIDHPVVLATLFHYRFLEIHPFDDGNGRMSRLLLNFILQTAGFPPAIIKQECKAAYYAALGKANKGVASADESTALVGEADELVAFIARSLTDSQLLLLKAKRGEAISEMQDYDMRLALVTQALRTKQPPEEIQGTREVQRQVLTGFVAPVFKEIVDRKHHLDSIFPNGQMTLAVMKDITELVRIDVSRPIGELIEEAAADASVAGVELEYYADRSPVRAFPFTFSVTVQLDATGFALRSTLRERRFARIPFRASGSYPEAKDAAEVLLKNLVECLERMNSR